MRAHAVTNKRQNANLCNIKCGFCVTDRSSDFRGIIISSTKRTSDAVVYVFVRVFQEIENQVKSLEIALLKEYVFYILCIYTYALCGYTVIYLIEITHLLIEIALVNKTKTKVMIIIDRIPRAKKVTGFKVQ